MSKPIVNLDEVQYMREMRHGDSFDAKIAPISTHLGARKLAYNIIAVAPGKRAFPFHNHHTNEELFSFLTAAERLGLATMSTPCEKVISSPAHRVAQSSHTNF